MLKKIGLITVWIICFIIFDCVICRHLLHLGYPSDFSNYHTIRPPRIYTEFTTEWLAKETSFDKMKFWPDDDSIKIAFFGGSTGVPVNPEFLASELSKRLNKKASAANFSCWSANHTQHLHLLLEVLHNGSPDIVIFYGGRNETVQQGYHDPRPGYTYSYYYRGETPAFIKVLIENSALIGALEWKFNRLTNLEKLRREYKPFSKGWNKTIEAKYFENLALSKRVSESLPSKHFGNAKFIAFYQPYRAEMHPQFLKAHERIREKIKDYDYIIDLYDLYKPLGEGVFRDDCHVEQKATDLLTSVIAEITADKILKNKKGAKR